MYNKNNDAFNLLVQERNITVSEKEQEINNLKNKISKFTKRIK